ASALRGGAVALYAYRDLRDVAYSLVHLHGLPFETAHGTHRLLHACLSNDAFWRAQPNVLVQRYEGLIADPPAAVRQIANHLAVVRERGWSAEEMAAGWLGRERHVQELAARELALRLELGDVRGHAQGLEALADRLHGVIAGLRDRYEAESRRLEELERLGPVALGVARRVHPMAERHPRLPRAA